MEFDKRILADKKPLDCFDAENKELIRPFLNKQGYFSNKLKNFCFLNKCSKRILNNVFKEKDQCFETIFKDCNINYWQYFLPAEWVKVSEKKYRAFTLAEWVDQHEIGEVIRFRNTCNQEFNVMYLGYILDTNDDIQDTRTKGQIMFVSSPYTLQELFERYEICINGEWKPFGIEVEE